MTKPKEKTPSETAKEATMSTDHVAIHVADTAPHKICATCGHALPTVGAWRIMGGKCYHLGCPSPRTEPSSPRSEPGWPDGRFKFGDRVRKIRGSQWQGRVCGWYQTENTPTGWCVESEREIGSVQVWPDAALEPVE